MFNSNSSSFQGESNQSGTAPVTSANNISTFDPNLSPAPPENAGGAAGPNYSNPVQDSPDPSNGVATAQLQPNPYNITWKGSPNFWSGRDGQTTVAICNHIMQGTLTSTNDWFKSRRSEVSSHFGVGRNGTIWQWVKMEDTAWANGILQTPDLSLDWLRECVQKKLNPNTRTVSIEHEGYSGTPFTEEQYKATLWLHRYLCSTYGIKADREHVVGHYQITSRDRATCPGPAFPWQRLLPDLADLASGSGPAVSSVPLDLKKWTDGVTGVVISNFGPGKVKINQAYVRSRPSLSSQDNTLVRTLASGKNLQFSGYTDAGPAYKGNSRWFLLSGADGGGWIHSSQIE